MRGEGRKEREEGEDARESEEREHGEGVGRGGMHVTGG